LIGFEYLGKGWVLVWLLLVWLVLTGQRRLVQSAFLALIVCTLAVNPLKVGVGRARPSDVKVESESKNNRTGRHMSFPSGDTAVVFAVATTVLAFSRRPLAVLLLGVCTGIGLLRIAGMAHYPSDVLAGAGIGCLCGWLAVQIGPRWVRWQIPQSDLSRRLAILGIVVIPIVFGLDEGIKNLPILLGTYGVSGILVLLAAGKMRCCRTN
jgi:undecaprenyl-diphosphatase